MRVLHDVRRSLRSVPGDLLRSRNHWPADSSTSKCPNQASAPYLQVQVRLKGTQDQSVEERSDRLASRHFGIGALAHPGVAPRHPGRLPLLGGVDIFFGYYPARRAANLNPIDALNYK